MIVRLLGLLSLATALYDVRPIWQLPVDLWFHLRWYVQFWHYLQEHFARIWTSGIFTGTMCVLFELVLIAKLFVAYGLLRVYSWARPLAITVLTADFVFRASGALTLFLFDAFLPATPETSIPDGSVTFEIPIWPSYVIAIISIASVLLLIQKPIKNLFSKSKSLTDNLA